MFHRRRSRVSRFQLYIALTGLAFTMISAGVGLMQTSLSTRLITTTNTSRISQGDYNNFGKESNVMFPLGEFLLIAGLAIVSSILLQSFISYSKDWVRLVGPWYIRGQLIRARWIRSLLFGGLMVAIFLILQFLPPDLSTIYNLYSDLKVHHNLPWIFVVQTLLFTTILYVDGRSRR